MKEIQITIIASGAIGSGKTRAIDKMIDALKDEFEITGQQPRQQFASIAEQYTFVMRMK